MKHVIMYSGGVSSWAAAKRVVQHHGVEGVTLLFCDTKSEHPDTYRFLRDSAANVGAPLVEIADGRTIWEVFRDVRFLGNNRVAPCSRVLKYELARRWVEGRYLPEDTTLYVGLDWTEPHRTGQVAEGWAPYRVLCPLLEAPYLTKHQLLDWAATEGLPKQELYSKGARHANCGGGCVRMGIGGWARVLNSMPDTYAEWERNEEQLRAQLGDVAMLRDRRGGETKPLTLRALRERLSRGEVVDVFDIGACNCFVGGP